MKKLILTMAILVGLSVSAQAFTITKVGSVKSAEYNDLMDKFYKKEVGVWAGVDPDGYHYVEFKFDGGLKDLEVGLWQPTDDTPSSLYGYLKWEGVLAQAIEWGDVAKTNQVDHSATIGDCSNNDIKCKARFTSISNGKTVYVTFELEDKENQFYKAEPIIMLEDIRMMNDIFMTKVPAHWKKVRGQATKDTSNLFN